MRRQSRAPERFVAGSSHHPCDGTFALERAPHSLDHLRLQTWICRTAYGPIRATSAADCIRAGLYTPPEAHSNCTVGPSVVSWLTGALLELNCTVTLSIDWPEPFGLVMIEAMACGRNPIF
jgi:hypothetical protein